MTVLKTALRAFGDGLRKAVHITITLSLLFTALFGCWFIANFLMKLMGLLERTMFSEPW